VGRDQRHAHARHHRLLDRLVAPDLHARAGGRVVGGDQPAHKVARAGPGLAQQERLTRDGAQRDAAPPGERVVGRRDDGVRVVPDDSALWEDPTMRITQDTFSFLPDPTDDRIKLRSATA
jgi:hypothetical protein